MSNFDYQKKVWGATEIKLSPAYLGYLRLKYALTDLQGVSGRVLDAGCGGGGFAKAIKHYRPDLRVYGLDIAESAINFAKKDPQGVKFSVGDLYELPFNDEYFDAVVVEDVLEHLEAPEKVLREASRVLKRAGLFHAFVPLEGEPYTAHFWFDKFGWRAKEKLAGHIQKFKLVDLTEMLEKQNLNVKKKRYTVHFLGQIVDVGYFTFLESTGKKLNVGLEQHLEGRTVLKSIKDLIISVSNFESIFLYFLPASGVHLLCRKS